MEINHGLGLAPTSHQSSLDLKRLKHPSPPDIGRTGLSYEIFKGTATPLKRGIEGLTLIVN